MERIPDADWIRETEMTGMPSPEPVHCPVCGGEIETIYTDKDGDVIGCDNCIKPHDIWDWMDKNI